MKTLSETPIVFYRYLYEEEDWINSGKGRFLSHLKIQVFSNGTGYIVAWFFLSFLSMEMYKCVHIFSLMAILLLYQTTLPNSIFEIRGTVYMKGGDVQFIPCLYTRIFPWWDSKLGWDDFFLARNWFTPCLC